MHENAYGTRLSEMHLCIFVCPVPLFSIVSESPEPLPIVLCNRYKTANRYTARGVLKRTPITFTICETENSRFLIKRRISTDGSIEEYTIEDPSSMCYCRDIIDHIYYSQKSTYACRMIKVIKITPHRIKIRQYRIKN
jgi:hypothetical protein